MILDYVITGLALTGIFYFHHLRWNNEKANREMVRRELKYQRHLRNVFDYQLQMYAFMADNDPEGFKLASEQVSEELNKCEEILKMK